MNPPIVTVDTWTLDQVDNGKEFVFHDSGNPQHEIAVRVWVENGSMRAAISNKAGYADTGARRPVTPCPSAPPIEPPPIIEPPIEPPITEPPPVTNTFALKRHDGGYLCVGPDKFLTQHGSPATFEIVDLGDDTIGLKANGKFCAAEGDQRIKADRETAGEWEVWQQGNGEEPDSLAFLSHQELYLSAHDDGTVAADMPHVGGWESFVKAPPPATGSGSRPPITGPLTAGSGRVFYDERGAPWRYMGVSAFPLCRLYTDGHNIQPFLDAFPGYNVLRVWDYVPWPGTGWHSCTIEQWKAFLAFVGGQGWRVELTLLTDDDPSRIGPAETLVRNLAGTKNLLVEIGNEPQTNKNIDTTKLRSACDASGLLYASGNYEQNEKWFGRFGTAHTPRDEEWPRKGHDLMEYYQGGGPSKPSDVACKAPWVGDEPIRPEQATTSYGKVKDFRAYGGVCALLGAGATFHFAGGRFGQVPVLLDVDADPKKFTTQFSGGEEAQCAAALLEGLTAFNPDAPNWGYRRLDEQGGSLRTYVLGDRCMVRVRPTQPNPESGWQPIDADGILYRR